MKPAVCSLPFVMIHPAGCSSLHSTGAGQIPGTADTPGYRGAGHRPLRHVATHYGPGWGAPFRTCRTTGAAGDPLRPSVPGWPGDTGTGP